MCQLHRTQTRLKEARQELSTARKIIQLLQEDATTKPDSNLRTQCEQRVIQKVQFNNCKCDSDKTVLSQIQQKADIPHKIGFKIPTFINGKLTNCEVRSKQKLADKVVRNSSENCIHSSHKVIIRGDSHLKSFATRINQFINTKSSVSSFIKPGAFLNQITPTQEYDPRVTEKKEEIVSECVSNDTDNTSDKSDTSIPVTSQVNDLKDLGTKDVIILSVGSNDLDHYCGKSKKFYPS